MKLYKFVPNVLLCREVCAKIKEIIKSLSGQQSSRYNAKYIGTTNCFFNRIFCATFLRFKIRSTRLFSGAVFEVRGFAVQEKLFRFRKRWETKLCFYNTL